MERTRAARRSLSGRFNSGAVGVGFAHQLHRELTFRHLPQRIEGCQARELGPDDLLSAEGELG